MAEGDEQRNKNILERNPTVMLILATIIGAIVTGIFMIVTGDVRAVERENEFREAAIIRNTAAAIAVAETVRAERSQIETRTFIQAEQQLEPREIEVTRLITEEVTRIVEIPSTAQAGGSEVTRIVEVEVEITRLVTQIEEVEVTRIVEISQEGLEAGKTPAPANVIVSTFDETSREGWGFTNGEFENPGTGGSGGGQNNGALIYVIDGRNTSYYVAPTKFHTDWRSFTVLSVDLWSSGEGYFDSSTGSHGSYGDIYIANGFATAQRLLRNRPPQTFETYVIPLENDGEWIFGGGATKIDDVLVNVTDLQIRAEYATGTDIGGLDNVILVPRGE